MTSRGRWAMGLKDNQRKWSDGLTQTRWDDFERLLAVYYRDHGYQVQHVGTGGSASRYDGGIDLRLRRDGELTVVQCKHWNAKQIPHNAVHELIGVMATAGAQRAILVTSGEFTRYARESAAKVGTIELVDGDELRQRLGILMPAMRDDPSPMRSMAEQFTGVLVDAAVDRIANRTGRRSTVVQASVGVMAIKTLAFLLLVAFVIFVVPRLLASVLTSTLPPSKSAPAQAVQSETQPVIAQEQHQPPPKLLSQRSSPPTYPTSPPASGGARQPIAEIGAADEMMTPEELDEWKRKNAESMKVLEGRVPELRH